MNEQENDYLKAYRGYFRNLLRWEELDAFWGRLRHDENKAWFIYAVGELPPAEPTDHARLNTFVDEIDQLLHAEHDEDYCGIVYVDDVESPSFIKIYDPNNLGSVCGSGSAPPPLPGWVLSLLPPCDLNAAFPPPANRRRWWQRVFHG